MAYASGYDEPNGILIGDFYTTWQLFYNGRPQSQKQYATSHYEAIAAARLEVDRLKSEFKGAPHYLYQDDKLWIARIQN